MAIDWWSLGLQAINVLVLVWLLSRVFWRPVAAAITRRQEASRDILAAADDAQARADAALADAAQARDGIANEREQVLAEARKAAESAKEAALAEAQDRAQTLLDGARQTIAREREAARKDNAARAAELSTEIAAKLLSRLNTPAVRDGFLDTLVDTIAQMPASDRAALVASTEGIELVCATELAEPEKARIEHAVTKALGGAVGLSFVTEPDLIAGLELRTAHFVLHNSWQADLARLLRDLKHAA